VNTYLHLTLVIANIKVRCGRRRSSVNMYNTQSVLDSDPVKSKENSAPTLVNTAEGVDIVDL
jgi:hypothetical protein